LNQGVFQVLSTNGNTRLEVMISTGGLSIFSSIKSRPLTARLFPAPFDHPRVGSTSNSPWFPGFVKFSELAKIRLSSELECEIALPFLTQTSVSPTS